MIDLGNWGSGAYRLPDGGGPEEAAGDPAGPPEER
jgi:hypothetical protein